MQHHAFVPVFAVVLALALGTAACGGDSSGPDDAGITGTYALQTVANDDGAQNLPATHQGAFGGEYTFTSGSLTLAANGTYTRTGSFTYDDIITDGDLGDTGTFTRSGADLTFTSDQSDPFTGTVDGDELTLVFPVVNAADEFTFVFQVD